MAKKSEDAAKTFTDMIRADREKKKHEQLAQSMLGRNSRRASASGAVSRKQDLSASLASRMGISKLSRSASSTPKPRSVKPDVEGQWVHDLHENGSKASRARGTFQRASSSSQLERSQRLLDGLQRGDSFTIRSAPPPTSSMSIKGLAHTGPFVVIASNFAPGTTAEDIKEAMKPHGGPILNCKLLSAKPTVMAEIVFEEKDGAQNVIDTFNNQKADGRLLYVYMKLGGPSPDTKRELAAAQQASQTSTPAPLQQQQTQPPSSMEAETMEVEEEPPATQPQPQQSQQQAQQQVQQPQSGQEQGRRFQQYDNRQPRDREYYEGSRGQPYRNNYYQRAGDYSRGGSYNNGYGGGYGGYRR